MIHVHVFFRYMYWTDLDGHTPRVERARMDGTERVVLPGVDGASIKQPSNVAIDPLTRDVYWSAVFDDFEKIVKYSEGQEEELYLSGNNKYTHIFIAVLSAIQGSITSSLPGIGHES